jgi:hypothetical protein
MDLTSKTRFRILKEYHVLKDVWKQIFQANIWISEDSEIETKIDRTHKSVVHKFSKNLGATSKF